jgi:hypothetical protein
VSSLCTESSPSCPARELINLDQFGLSPSKLLPRRSPQSIRARSIMRGLCRQLKLGKESSNVINLGAFESREKEERRGLSHASSRVHISPPEHRRETSASRSFVSMISLCVGVDDLAHCVSSRRSKGKKRRREKFPPREASSSLQLEK